MGLKHFMLTRIRQFWTTPHQAMVRLLVHSNFLPLFLLLFCFQLLIQSLFMWLIAQKETDCSFKSQFSLIELIKICTLLLHGRNASSNDDNRITAIARSSNQKRANRKRKKRVQSRWIESRRQRGSECVIKEIPNSLYVFYNKEWIICILLR